MFNFMLVIEFWTFWVEWNVLGEERSLSSLWNGMWKNDKKMLWWVLGLIKYSIFRIDLAVLKDEKLKKTKRKVKFCTERLFHISSCSTSLLFHFTSWSIFITFYFVIITFVTRNLRRKSIKFTGKIANFQSKKSSSKVFLFIQKSQNFFSFFPQTSVENRHQNCFKF